MASSSSSSWTLTSAVWSSSSSSSSSFHSPSSDAAIVITSSTSAADAASISDTEGVQLVYYGWTEFLQNILPYDLKGPEQFTKKDDSFSFLSERRE